MCVLEGLAALSFLTSLKFVCHFSKEDSENKCGLIYENGLLHVPKDHMLRCFLTLSWHMDGDDEENSINEDLNSSLLVLLSVNLEN